MRTHRGRGFVSGGLILAVVWPWVSLAGEFDLDDRRTMASVRNYPPNVVDALIALADRPEVLRRGAENPEAVWGDPRLDNAARIALLELSTYPGLISIAADGAAQLRRLAALQARSSERFAERVSQLREQYENHTRNAAAQWQRILDRDSAALGEYRELLTAFCEFQKQRFADFPFVAARSRAYYLACPPDEAVLAFAAQNGVSETLGRVLERWAADYSPAALDERILENGEDTRGPRADEVLPYLPAARRAGMWCAETSPDDLTIGLIPVMLQPAGDQPLEARNARLAAETARLWSEDAAPVVRQDDRSIAHGERRFLTSDATSPAVSRGVAPPPQTDELDVEGIGWPGAASRAVDISSLRSDPWTPYTEVVPSEGYSEVYPERYDLGDGDWHYRGSDYGYRGYATYNDRRYPGSWQGYGTSLTVGGSYRFYDAYSCGVPVYYGSRAVAACPPTVVWQPSTPLFVRDRSARSGVSISIGLRDNCDSRWPSSFRNRSWGSEPVRWGRGRDSSERAHIESSADSLRRRPSSVTQVPTRPYEPNAEQRIRSARQNLTHRLDELRERAARNTQSIGRRTGPSAPAGQPAMAPPGSPATIRRGPAAPAGRPAVEPGASGAPVPRRSAIAPGTSPRRVVQPAGSVQNSPASRRSISPAQPSNGSTKSVRPTAVPPRGGAAIQSGTGSSSSRGPIQRVKRSTQPGQPNKP